MRGEWGNSMRRIRSLCVYLGSNPGNDPAFAKLADDFGTQVALNDVRLVFGGGQVGLMKIVADACLRAGGTVSGIITDHLHEIEIGHDGLDELLIVPNMHVRKMAMFEKSDAFVILPGGLGTLDELMEIMTWRQIGLHDKPIVIVNYRNYWAKLLELLGHIIDNGFAKPSALEILTVVQTAEEVLPALMKLAEPHLETSGEFI